MVCSLCSFRLDFSLELRVASAAVACCRREYTKQLAGAPVSSFAVVSRFDDVCRGGRGRVLLRCGREHAAYVIPKLSKTYRGKRIKSLHEPGVWVVCCCCRTNQSRAKAGCALFISLFRVLNSIYFEPHPHRQTESPTAVNNSHRLSDRRRRNTSKSTPLHGRRALNAWKTEKHVAGAYTLLNIHPVAQPVGMKICTQYLLDEGQQQLYLPDLQ